MHICKCGDENGLQPESETVWCSNVYRLLILHSSKSTNARDYCAYATATTRRQCVPNTDHVVHDPSVNTFAHVSDRGWIDVRCPSEGRKWERTSWTQFYAVVFFTQRRVNGRYYDTRLLFAFMICRRYSLLLVVQNYSLSKWRRGKVGLWNGWVKMQNYT